jgi:hypothetical protein
VWDVNAGIVVGFPTKAAAIPSWPGVLATRGAPAATPLFAHFLSFRFQSFDAMVLGLEDAIADIHASRLYAKAIPIHQSSWPAGPTSADGLKLT